MTDDGVAHIFDPVDLRLAHASEAGLEFTDLVALDILSVTAMTSDGLDLILVEVFFGPVRQRIHRLDQSRNVVATVDLPPGYRLEDGLSGVFADDDGDVVLEFGGGGIYGRYDAATGTFDKERSPVLRGVEVDPRPPDLVVDGVELTADLTGAFGSLRYLATDLSGRHIVERTDVLNTSPIEVLRTVEWWAPDGRFLLSALVPTIDEQAIDQPPGLAVMPAGDVIVLLALEDSVVVRPLVGEPERIG